MANTKKMFARGLIRETIGRSRCERFLDSTPGCIAFFLIHRFPWEMRWVWTNLNKESKPFSPSLIKSSLSIPLRFIDRICAVWLVNLQSCFSFLQGVLPAVSARSESSRVGIAEGQQWVILPKMFRIRVLRSSTFVARGLAAMCSWIWL